MLNKTIALGSMGSLVLSEAAGKVSAVITLAEQTAGSIPGAGKASLSASVELDGQAIIDVGLELLVAKFPSAAGLIEGLKAILDAEIKNV